MCANESIPRHVLNAYELLKKRRPDVAITIPLRRSPRADDTTTEFECALAVPENAQGIPRSVEVRVEMDDWYPLTSVTVTPVCTEVRGFPHQDAWTGKLCLKDERLAPLKDERLLTYVAWAEEWLADAAMERLLQSGHPYELPDFSVKESNAEMEKRYDGQLFFHETTENFDRWQPRIGTMGTVELAIKTSPKAIVPIEFRTCGKEVVRRGGYANAYIENCERIIGRWAMVKDIRYYRNRPPQTYKELAELLGPYKFDVDAFFRKAWKDESNKESISAVLIGWPIPKYIGGSLVRVQWRAIAFRNYDYYCKKMADAIPRKKLKAIKVWPNMQANMLNPLPWIGGENLAAEDLHARWMLSGTLRHMCVGIIGCGAVGSMVTEIFVRGGVERMHLYDGDILRYGNLSRHTLCGWEVNKGKAEMLALKVRSINPLASIAGHEVNIPIVGKSEGRQKAEDSLNECDLYVDCSTTERAGAWLSGKARRERKRMVMMFIDYRSELLTLCIAGRNTECAKVEELLYEDVKKGITPLEWDKYSKQPTDNELIIPSPGCWHPTFPAALVDIMSLVACAISELNQWIAKPEQCSGVGLIIRRNRGELAEKKGLVEITWRKDYR